MPPAPDPGWLFDEGSGTSAAASHGGYSATLQNGAGWSSSTPFGYAGDFSLSLDGNDDFAEVAALGGIALNGASAFAISAWVRAAVTPADRAFFGGADPSTADVWGGRYDSVGWLNGNSSTTELIKFGMQVDGTGHQYESSGGYQQSAWQHILFTWESGAGARLYVDGVLDVPSETSAGLATATGVVTGQSRFLIGDGAKASWAGEIDELLVWRQALTQDNAEWLATHSAAAIPEPGTASMLALGLAIITLRARRR